MHGSKYCVAQMNIGKWTGRFLILTFVTAFFALACEPAFTLLVDRLDASPFSAADLEPGGPYLPEEKALLLSSCLDKHSSTRELECNCFADRAGTELPRAERKSLVTQWSFKFLESMRIGKGIAVTANQTSQFTGSYLLSVMRQNANKLAATCGLGTIH